MSGSASVLEADARSLPLAGESVDLVVTSPPYFALRSYTDEGEHYDGQVGAEGSPREYVEALIEATSEMARVVKPQGSIWVNLGDKYASAGGHTGQGETSQRRGRSNVAQQSRGTERAPDGTPRKSLMLLPERYRIAAVDQLGLIARAVVVWHKANPMPESVTDRVKRSHEDWVHLTKQPRYYSAVDEIREPHTSGDHGARRRARSDRRADTAERWGHRQDKHTQLPPQPGDPEAFHALGKLPGSVWTIPTEPLRAPDRLGVDHFAAMPTEWPRRLIAAFCPEGGTVLDPFGGSGTTALVARALGRHGITADLSTDYCRLAAWRTNDAGQLGRVRGRHYADRQQTLGAAVNDAQRLADETRRGPGEIAPVERDLTRRLTEPTGQPPEPDAPTPAHASGAGAASDMRGRT